MASEIPPQLQDQVAQLQTLQQQLKVALQQRSQMEFQVKESERALEELGSADPETPVYRAVGNLLVKTAGRDDVKKKLEEDLESLKIRLKSFEKQEGRIKEKATELQSKLQAALKNLNLTQPGPPARSKG